MCGIAGIFSPENILARQTIASLAASFHHRGPDDTGFLTHDFVTSPNIHNDIALVPGSHLVLIHKRLAIIDLSAHGFQPMSSECHRYHLVFNGEIYNYLALKKQLSDEHGCRFKGSSDSEVLLQAYLTWGEHCLTHLQGMFAFVIYDSVAKTFFLARDHCGIKPLYYTTVAGGFAFASELKTLLLIPSVSRTLDRNTAYHYLLQGKQECGEATFLANIHALPAAHSMVYDLTTRQTHAAKRFWQLPASPVETITLEEAAAKVCNAFQASVAQHMQSDVPIAATLSGGIDSSAIVMNMRKSRSKDFTLNTISFIANDKSINEERWIDIVNHASLAKANKVRLNYDNIPETLDKVIHIQGQPFGSTSIAAQYQVFAKIKELGFKVVLDGQGADEMLAGYRSFLYYYQQSLFKRGRWLDALRLSFNILRLPGIWHYGKRVINDRLLQRRSSNNNSIIVPEYFANVQLLSDNTRYNLRSKLAQSFTDTSLPALLRYEDRNAMAWSIENRVPFLDPTLIETIFSLPEQCFIDLNGQTKLVFRHAMQNIVPTQVLKRRDKIGFATAEESLLKQNRDWVEATLLSPYARDLPMINTQAMHDDWCAYLNGKRGFSWRFWRYVNFIRWMEQQGIQA